MLARLLPRPQRPGGPRILVAGSGVRRTLPLAARYGDIWNGPALSVEEFRNRTARLNELLRQEGRSPTAVQRSLMLGIVCWRDNDELERRMSWARRLFPHLADCPSSSLLESVSRLWHLLAGSPSEVITSIRAYEAAGLDELIVQWFDVTNLDGLQVLSEHVRPFVSLPAQSPLEARRLVTCVRMAQPFGRRHSPALTTRLHPLTALAT